MTQGWIALHRNLSQQHHYWLCSSCSIAQSTSFSRQHSAFGDRRDCANSMRVPHRRLHTSENKTTWLKDYQRPNWTIESVKLSFDLRKPEHTTVKSSLSLSQSKYSDEGVGLELDTAQPETIRKLWVGDKELVLGEDFTFACEDKLVVSPTVVDGKNEIVLSAESTLKPEDNKSLVGLYSSNGIICTQCEPEGFRMITPYLDRPDILAIFETEIIAPKKDYPVVLSNGNRISHVDVDDENSKFVFHDPFPKPSYLFALVAGDLERVTDRFRTRSGREVQLNIYVQHGNGHKTSHAMHSLKQSMMWDEAEYGLEYDLDVFNIVAVDYFNMGAMENKSLNIFNSKYVLADSETATDTDFDNISTVVAHEYFHNWTGNRVTCRDWFQLSLKEGLTVFRDQCFSQYISPTPCRVDHARVLRNFQFPEDSGPLSHPVRPVSYQQISNFYTTTIYQKGAEVVRMLQIIVGNTTFKEGLALYFRRHDGQAVTCEDFVKCMEDVCDQDLGQFMRWYSTPGTPLVILNWKFDNTKAEFSISFKQVHSDSPGVPASSKLPLHIPIRMALLDPLDGSLLSPPVKTDACYRWETDGSLLLHLKSHEAKLTFESTYAEPAVSLLREFSAPIKLSVPSETDEALTLKMKSDTDAFSKWDASQTIATRVILAACASPAALAEESTKLFLDAWKAPLLECLTPETTPQQRALSARCLSLPSETELKGLADPIVLNKSRFMVRKALGQEHLEILKMVEEGCANVLEDDMGAHARASRQLRGLVLWYLAFLQDEDVLDVCCRIVSESKNMTLQVAALAAVTDLSVSQREEVFETFYSRWSHNKSVVQKWFALQAMSSRQSTLKDIERLMRNDQFDITLPNDCYALLAGMSETAFHSPNGEGYEFLSEQIISIDTFNSEVAARLVKRFSEWGQYDDDRQRRMYSSLERLARNTLSVAVQEIVSKSLKSISK